MCLMRQRIILISSYCSLPIINFVFLSTVHHLTSQCEYVGALRAFHGEIFSDPPRVALLGCGCSVSTEPVAGVSHFWNISQVHIYYIRQLTCVLLKVEL